MFHYETESTAARARCAPRLQVKRSALRSVLAVALLLLATSAAGDTPDFSAPHDPEHLLVRFKPGTGEQARQLAHAATSALEVRRYRIVEGLTLVKVPPDRLEEACSGYLNNPNVLYAEPDYLIEFSTDPCEPCDTSEPNCPDDPHFSTLWGLHNTGQTIEHPQYGPDPGTCDADVDALEAWDIWTGDHDFEVAVLDTGVVYDHVDLAGNFGEDKGYDFGDDDSDPEPEPQNLYHGTHVAGTIGAVGDNSEGVVGVNWRCRIVALKVYGKYDWVDAAAFADAAAGWLVITRRRPADV